MTDTLRIRLKRGIYHAQAQGLSVQHIVMRPDTHRQLNEEVKRIRPSHFLGYEIQITFRPDAPEWELRLWDEWEAPNGEQRIYFNANDLPESITATQEQRELEANPLYGMF